MLRADRSAICNPFLPGNRAHHAQARAAHRSRRGNGRLSGRCRRGTLGLGHRQRSRLRKRSRGSNDPDFPSHVRRAALARQAVLGFSAAAWNGLWATAQAEIGGHHLAGSSLGASLTIIQIFGGITTPLFGALVDRTNFTIAWELLAVVVALGIIPAVFARRYLYGGRCAATS